jgi:hypothetical protein
MVNYATASFVLQPPASVAELLSDTDNVEAYAEATELVRAVIASAANISIDNVVNVVITVYHAPTPTFSTQSFAGHIPGRQLLQVSTTAAVPATSFTVTFTIIANFVNNTGASLDPAAVVTLIAVQITTNTSTLITQFGANGYTVVTTIPLSVHTVVYIATPTPSAASSSDSFPLYAQITAAVGGVAFVTLIIIVTVLCVRKHQRALNLMRGQALRPAISTADIFTSSKFRSDDYEY